MKLLEKNNNTKSQQDSCCVLRLKKYGDILTKLKTNMGCMKVLIPLAHARVGTSLGTWQPEVNLF